MRLKKTFDVASKDKAIMERYYIGRISAEKGAEMISKTNDTECSVNDFISLCIRCGFNVNAEDQGLYFKTN
ncbi:MAG: hypothetical protein Q4C64_04090 [Erysipelotrichia bacterium]|nr:hypothetical protein [Erysipelotrichia bacterium]